jgi:hypothetical protein
MTAEFVNWTDQDEISNLYVWTLRSVVHTTLNIYRLSSPGQRPGDLYSSLGVSSLLAYNIGIFSYETL